MGVAHGSGGYYTLREGRAGVLFIRGSDPSALPSQLPVGSHNDVA